MAAQWKKRLTYVTTTRQNTTARSASVGTVISAERLVGVKVRCPRCDAPAATLWRRFDYFGPGLPLYFTKCGRCHRRRPVNADEAAFLLLEPGIVDPMQVIHDGLPEEGAEVGGDPSTGGPGGSVAEAEKLVVNRQRAYGKKHPLTFAARAGLADAIGVAGDPEEAVRQIRRIVDDQRAALGTDSPAVLANRYRAAIWTAHGGDPAEALVALRSLLPDQETILGADHGDTLATRATIAQLVDLTGDRGQAITILRQVRQDQLRVLGSEHPATEATRRLLAEWEAS